MGERKEKRKTGKGSRKRGSKWEKRGKTSVEGEKEI